jgi:hypothetical protein
MKSSKARSVWIGLAVLLFVALAPGLAQAQDEEKSAGPTRIAVLNVPGGGTEPLLDKLGEIPELEILRQDWFIKQIQNRGFDPKGIMRRPKDLKWVMDGGDLDYVLFLAPVSEQSYEARIVGKDGSITKKINVDRTPDGLSESGAELLRRELDDFLAAKSAKVTKLGGTDEAPRQGDDQTDEQEDDLDPNELKARAATEKDAKTTALSKNWLYATGSARFMQRGFNVVSANAETLSYQSSFYPGVHLAVEAYPFGMTNPDFQAVGLYTDFRYGGDSVTAAVAQEDGSLANQSLNISHTEFAFGVALRGENPAEDMDSDPDPHTRLKLGIEYVNFGIDPNEQLPSISHFHITIGGGIDYPFLADGLYATFGAELTPVGFLSEEAEMLFGQSSSSFGMSGSVGLMFKFTEAIGLAASYDARVFRTTFEGEGEANFVNANSLELVQGFSAGLQYHY